MTSRPAGIHVGDEVRFGGGVHIVLRILAGQVELADVTGRAQVVAIPLLLSDYGFEVLAARTVRPPLAPEAVLEGLPEHVVAQARWWERHLIELVTGRLPDADAGVAINPLYDPRVRTMRQRETAKVAELVASGHKVSLATLQRQRRDYQTEGLWGLVDHRYAKRASVAGHTDERIVVAVRAAMDGETNRSTGTVDRLRRKVEQLLKAEYGSDAPVLPSRPTFYRLVQRLELGRHIFGSARTRRSLAKRPQGPFATVTAVRPGELMQIDSTPLDVRIVLDNGMIDRAELTAMVDIATRTIAAVVLRPTTKAVDAALLLARAMTPEPMRPGWTDALRLSRSVLPHRSMVSLDERLATAAARPVIVPETVVFDHGSVYLSAVFQSACRTLGITVQPAHPSTPTDKPVVERTLESVSTMFAQHVAGYVGSSVERRGLRAEQEAVWSLVELQDLLDEWIVAVWQNRPHDGLRHPLTPANALTPNEKYAALLQTTGYVPVPLTADDYIELLPAAWRVINTYGIRINNRIYDAKSLNPYRRQHSGVKAKKGLWEVHLDPYDVSRIWVRNHHDSGWLTVGWTHLNTVPVPFGEHAWSLAQKIVASRNRGNATEGEIAQAAAALLDTAQSGPARAVPAADRSHQRVAGRTRATAQPRWPRPDLPPESGQPRIDQHPPDEESIDLDVVPLDVFDARKEAQSWRW